MKPLFLSAFLGGAVCFGVFLYSASSFHTIAVVNDSLELTIRRQNPDVESLFIFASFHDRAAVKEAYSTCLKLCFAAKNEGESWSNGPCLSSGIVNKGSFRKSNSTNRWGCDIAHCPRLQVDNIKSNQCDKSHWIELDTDCNFLRFREGLSRLRQGVFCDATGSRQLF
mmetsp:Transcript_11455/g.14883  ORF Transcript_11455/g.14883 Transcript_11455/m.14883 type:complete len:168 (+) Transcript_11455:225-728(+)